MASIILVIGAATLLNLTIIIHRVRNYQFFNAALDATLMISAASIFAGTFSGMAVAMIASAGVSVYLWWRPVFVIPPHVSQRVINTIRGWFGNNQAIA